VLKRDKALVVLLPVLAAAFGLGVARLFQLRFEAGDVYPPYSSLRSDPLGTKALYESLEGLPSVAVGRFIQRFDQLPDGRNTTLLVFGADSTGMNRSTEDEYKQMEQFMFAGGRIVIALAPLNTRPWAARREEARERSRAREGDKSDEPDRDDSGRKRRRIGEEEELPDAKLISLRDRWDVEFDYEDLPRNGGERYQAVAARKQMDGDLPESLVWHTSLYFNRPGASWRVTYSRDSHPVLIERRFGSGSLVFSADSYFLSNEAMRKERHPQLLAWMIGRNATVLFDETHLGVTESPGIAALVRKYRLHGLVIGLILMAGLFVWKNAVRFVPAHADERADAVAGRESAAGFVNLLRRSIESSQIVPVCLAEWKRTRAHGRADLVAKVERAATVIAEEQGRPARERNVVESYKQISRILSERSEFKVSGSGSEKTSNPKP